MARSIIADAFVSITPSAKNFAPILRQQLTTGFVGVAGFMDKQADLISKPFRERVTSAISGALSLAGKLAAGAGVAFAAFGLKAAAQFQQIEIAFKTLFSGVDDGAQKAQGALKFLFDFAARTPFTVPGLAQLVQTLTGAFGPENFSQVKDTVEAISGVGAALGVNEGAIRNAALAIAEIKGQGFASAKAMRQLTINLDGFNPRAALAAKLGISIAEVNRQLFLKAIPASVAIEALNEGMRNFPGAAQALINQAKTLNGVMATLSDRVKQAFFEGFKGPVEQIADVFLELELGGQGLIDTIAGFVQQFAASVGAAIPSLLQNFQTIISAGTQIVGEPLKGLISAITSAVDALTPIIVSLLDEIGLMGPAFQTVGEIVARVFGALSQVVDAVLPALRPLMDLIVTIGDVGSKAFVALAEALTPALAQLATMAGPVFDRIGEVVIQLGPALDELAAVVGELAGAFVELVGATGDAFSNAALAAASVLIPPLTVALQAFADVVGALAPLIQALSGPLGVLLTGLLAFKAVAGIGGMFRTLAINVRQFGAGLKTGVVPAVSTTESGIRRMVSTFRDYETALSRAATATDAVKQATAQAAAGNLIRSFDKQMVAAAKSMGAGSVQLQQLTSAQLRQFQSAFETINKQRAAAGKPLLPQLDKRSTAALVQLESSITSLGRTQPVMKRIASGMGLVADETGRLVNATKGLGTAGAKVNQSLSTISAGLKKIQSIAGGGIGAVSTAFSGLTSSVSRFAGLRQAKVEFIDTRQLSLMRSTVGSFDDLSGKLTQLRNINVGTFFNLGPLRQDISETAREVQRAVGGSMADARSRVTAWAQAALASNGDVRQSFVTTFSDVTKGAGVIDKLKASFAGFGAATKVIGQTIGSNIVSGLSNAASAVGRVVDNVGHKLAQLGASVFQAMGGLPGLLITGATLAIGIFTSAMEKSRAKAAELRQEAVALVDSLENLSGGDVNKSLEEFVKNAIAGDKAMQELTKQNFSVNDVLTDTSAVLAEVTRDWNAARLAQKNLNSVQQQGQEISADTIKLLREQGLTQGEINDIIVKGDQSKFYDKARDAIEDVVSETDRLKGSVTDVGVVLRDTFSERTAQLIARGLISKERVNEILRLNTSATTGTVNYKHALSDLAFELTQTSGKTDDLAADTGALESAYSKTSFTLDQVTSAFKSAAEEMGKQQDAFKDVADGIEANFKRVRDRMKGAMTFEASLDSFDDLRLGLKKKLEDLKAQAKELADDPELGGLKGIRKRIDDEIAAVNRGIKGELVLDIKTKLGRENKQSIMDALAELEEQAKAIVEDAHVAPGEPLPMDVQLRLIDTQNTFFKRIEELFPGPENRAKVQAIFDEFFLIAPASAKTAGELSANAYFDSFTQAIASHKDTIGAPAQKIIDDINKGVTPPEDALATFNETMDNVKKGIMVRLGTSDPEVINAVLESMGLGKTAQQAVEKAATDMTTLALEKLAAPALQPAVQDARDSLAEILKGPQTFDVGDTVLTKNIGQEIVNRLQEERAKVVKMLEEQGVGPEAIQDQLRFFGVDDATMEAMQAAAVGNLQGAIDALAVNVKAGDPLSALGADMVETFFRNMSDSAKEQLTPTQIALATALAQIKPDSSVFLSFGNTLGVDFAKAVADGTNAEATNTLVSLETALSKMNLPPDVLATVGKAIGQGYMDAVKIGAGNNSDVTKQAIINVLKNMGLPTDTLTAIGRALGINLMNGVGAGASSPGVVAATAAKIDAAVKKVANIVQIRNGIQSPSTVWAEEIGMPLGEGIGVGLEAAVLESMPSTAKVVASTTLNALKKELKISSPSQLTFAVGVESGEGFLEGWKESMFSFDEVVEGTADELTKALKRIDAKGMGAALAEAFSNSFADGIKGKLSIDQALGTVEESLLKLSTAVDQSLVTKLQEAKDKLAAAKTKGEKTAAQKEIAEAQKEIDDATKKFAAGGLSITSEIGRQNREELRAAIQAGLDYAKALLEQGSSVDQVSKFLEDYRTRILNATDAVKLNRTEVEALLKQYGFTAEGIKGAADATDDVTQAVDALRTALSGLSGDTKASLLASPNLAAALDNLLKITGGKTAAERTTSDQAFTVVQGAKPGTTTATGAQVTYNNTYNIELASNVSDPALLAMYLNDRIMTESQR